MSGGTLENLYRNLLYDWNEGDLAKQESLNRSWNNFITPSENKDEVMLITLDPLAVFASGIDNAILPICQETAFDNAYKCGLTSSQRFVSEIEAKFEKQGVRVMTVALAPIAPDNFPVPVSHKSAAAVTRKDSILSSESEESSQNKEEGRANEVCMISEPVTSMPYRQPVTTQQDSAALFVQQQLVRRFVVRILGASRLPVETPGAAWLREQWRLHRHIIFVHPLTWGDLDAQDFINAAFLPAESFTDAASSWLVPVSVRPGSANPIEKDLNFLSEVNNFFYVVFRPCLKHTIQRLVHSSYRRPCRDKRVSFLRVSDGTSPAAMSFYETSLERAVTCCGAVGQKWDIGNCGVYSNFEDPKLKFPNFIAQNEKKIEQIIHRHAQLIIKRAPDEYNKETYYLENNNHDDKNDNVTTALLKNQ